jgi:hypothetical protein
MAIAKNMLKTLHYFVLTLVNNNGMRIKWNHLMTLGFL